MKMLDESHVHSNPEVARWLSGKDEDDAVVISFYKFRDTIVVTWSKPYMDINNIYLKVALNLLFSTGYKGRMLYVTGSSVPDVIEAKEAGWTDNKFETIKEISTEEGEYEKAFDMFPSIKEPTSSTI